MNETLLKPQIELIEELIYNSLNNDNQILSEILDFLKAPSKRIRSKIALLYILAQNKEVTKDIMSLLAAGELIHNASLFHDDVIDNSSVRRGNTTLAKKYSDKVSLIAGDLIISKAIKLIHELADSRITENFLNCTEIMCNAEINQYLSKGTILNINKYLEICRGKTASLFEAILKSAAILTGSDDSEAGHFAQNFGIIFQIRNDLEPNSAKQDKFNNLHTINDILSVEKTTSLIDNYKEEMRSIIKDFPQNVYKEELEDIVENL